MVRDYSRIQDLVLVLARWGLLGLLAYLTVETPEALVPLPLLGVLGAYALLLTIFFLGGWAATRGFAHVQSVGDLAVVVAALVLAPALAGPAFAALLVVAALIGLRRLPWPHTLAYAIVALGVGVLVATADSGPQPGLAAPLLAGGVVLLARLLAGDPLPPDLLERRPPVRSDQARALQALSKALAEGGDQTTLVREAHRLMQAHLGASRAAVVLLDEASDGGQAYTVVDGDLKSKPIALQRSGTSPAERVLREGRLRLARQREPIPVIDLLGDRGAASCLGMALRGAGETLGLLLAYDKEGGHPFTDQDEAFLELLATPLALALHDQRATAAAAQAAEAFPRALLAMLALRRPEAEAHAEQVARFAVAIAEHLRLPAEEIAVLRLGALLHDVGELGVAGDLFNRAQVLTTQEYERVKEHAWIGARLLAGLDQPPELLDIVYQHHERWDGAGYPQGLARADIVLGARIVAVADALDAITAERPYRAPRPVREALQELVANSGTQFDPTVVQALLAVVAQQGEGWVAAPPRRPKPQIEPWSGRVRRY